MNESVYDKYGGVETVSSVVHAFYRKVLDSERLEPYFEGIDMERLMDHQVHFLCKVLGGPDNYSGRSLAAAHRGLHIDHAAFTEVAAILQEVLEEAGVEDEDVRTTMDVVGSTYADIVESQPTGQPTEPQVQGARG